MKADPYNSPIMGEAANVIAKFGTTDFTQATVTPNANEWRQGISLDDCPTCLRNDRLCDDCERQLREEIFEG